MRRFVVKKILFFGLSAALVLGMCGCNKDVAPETNPTNSTPTIEETQNIDNTTEETVEIQDTDTVLQFGSETYGDSIQINQGDLDWATYDGPINDIIISSYYYLPNNLIIGNPDWNVNEINNTVIFQNDYDYIAVTYTPIGESAIESFKINVSDSNFTLENSETKAINLQIEEVNAEVQTGITQDGQYIAYIFDYYDYNYCFLASIHSASHRDVAMFEQGISDILSQTFMDGMFGFDIALEESSMEE